MWAIEGRHCGREIQQYCVGSKNQTKRHHDTIIYLFNSVSATMTRHALQEIDQNVPQNSSLSKYFTAVNNKHGVRHDLEALCKFVRETLFYALIHDVRGSGMHPNDEIMGENGKACQIFIHVFLRDKDKISNTELLESSREEREHYLKFLWREGLQKKGKYNIRKALSNEKSAVYAGICESFKSK
jgi:hypothetical protein